MAVVTTKKPNPSERWLTRSRKSSVSDVPSVPSSTVTDRGSTSSHVSPPALTRFPKICAKVTLPPAPPPATWVPSVVHDKLISDPASCDSRE